MSRHRNASLDLTGSIVLTSETAHLMEGNATVINFIARVAPDESAPLRRPPTAAQVVACLEEALRISAALQRLAGAVDLDANAMLRLLELSVTEPAEPTRATFTTAQTSALTEAGVDLSGPIGDGPTADARTLGHAVAQQSPQSWTIAEVAELLGRTSGRVRQQVADQTLYAVRGAGGELRLPKWQFTESNTLPGLEKLIPALPRALHPVAIERFMRLPLHELAMDAEPLTPCQWLARAGDPAAIAEIAAGLPSAG